MRARRPHDRGRGCRCLERRGPGSRQRLWQKGGTSGHVQRVHAVRLDCGGDARLLVVTQADGIACHTGRASCFYRTWTPDQGWVETDPLLKDPEDIYGA